MSLVIVASLVCLPSLVRPLQLKALKEEETKDKVEVFPCSGERLGTQRRYLQFNQIDYQYL